MNRAFVTTLAISAVCRAAILHVPADHPTIQACIDAAISGVDECVVAPGTYHETINFRSKAITVRSLDGADVTTIDATGIGGSVVTCVSVEGPDTVLDGFKITGGTGTLRGGYHQGGGMYNYRSSPTVTNCAFIENTASSGGGMSNDSSSPTVGGCLFNGNTADYGGGGMHNYSGSAIITNCTFSGNTSDAGGGMHNYDSNATVTHCAFTGNTAYAGGGMYNQQVYASSNPTVINCTFILNTAHSGAGMYNNSNSSVVTDCTFSRNTAWGTGGGGLYNNDFSNSTVANCTFSNNAAASSGGGMYNESSSPTVSNCTFSGNTAAYFGGGMDNYYSNPTVNNCTFTENAADLGSGGGMYNQLYCWPTVSYCAFTRNRAGSGGGIGNSNSGPAVTDCTFHGNVAFASGGAISYDHGSGKVVRCTFSGNIASYGGGMSSYAYGPEVANCAFTGNVAYNNGGGVFNIAFLYQRMIHCTFSENTAQKSGGAIFNDYFSRGSIIGCVSSNNTPDQIAHDSTSMSTIGFSETQGGLPVGAVDGGGNIDLEPMFVRPPDPGADGTWDGVDDDYGDLRLQAGSPCINTGDPAFVAQPGETDLDGHARVLCERVDMGAYEFGSGDYDCDQVVDLADFISWQACMIGPHDVSELALAALAARAVQLAIGCEPFDFDADGDVDLRDFAAFELVLTP